jgi:Ricin-type beta-trefoil lectin domain-like
MHSGARLSRVFTVVSRGKCLAASGGGTASGTKIVLYACNGSGAEKWRIVYNLQSGPSTTYVLWDFENPQSGRCLLDPGESAKSGTQLRLGRCDSSLSSNADWSQSR